MEIIFQRIAEELNVRTAQVVSAVNLLDDGATVPFVARYRKEATGGLDDTQLRSLRKTSATCVIWKTEELLSSTASASRTSCSELGKGL